MSPQEISYLARYLFSIVILLASAALLKSSIQDFRGRMKANMQPVRGFFLMGLQGKSAREERVKSFPLYHTSIIGSAKSSDIAINSPQVAHRHASIYLFDGHWYIRPYYAKAPVLLNRFVIDEPIPLEDQDVITIGDQRFVFVNERQAAYSEGLSYVENNDDLIEPPRQVPTRLAWWMVNIYMIAAGLMMIYLLRVELLSFRREVAIVFGSFIIALNLYYFIVPYFLRYVDRAILLATTQIAFLGLLIQTRFRFIGWTADELNADVLAKLTRSFRLDAWILAAGLFILPICILICAKTNFLEMVTLLCGIGAPLMLIATLVFGRGRETHGAALWLTIGGFSLQLTEFVKIFYLIVLAAFFKNRPPTKIQIAFACWAGLVFFLIMLLPDLGTAMILLPTTLVVFFVMTSEYLKTLGILIGGTALGALAYTMLPYVQRRISGWSSLWTEVNDANRQIVYGLQAIARGGLFGRGLGNGSPEGIPNAIDDMVFSSLSEELGLLTGLCIVLLFIVIWLRSTRITLQVRDGFTSSLMLGFATAFFMEAAVVIAGGTGLIPLTGATLPFIANGGSSLLAKFIMMGCLLGLAARRGGGAKIKHETIPQKR